MTGSMAEKTEFQMIPLREQLAEIDRDLQFRPSTTASPETLSTVDIAKFNSAGYLSPCSIFTEEEMVEHRHYFDNLLEKTFADGKDSYSISTAHLKYGRVYDLLCHPKIVDCVTDLLGPDVVGWGSHYFCKMPGDGKAVTWHQDASYWPLTPSKTVTVWLAVDDADRENACM